MSDHIEKAIEGIEAPRGPARRLVAFYNERRVIMPEEGRLSRGAKKKNTTDKPPSVAQFRLEALEAIRLPIKPRRNKKARGPIVAPPANNWIPLGPSVVTMGQAATRPNTSGRTPGIAVAPGGSRVYIATANGGVWRSEDSGNSWVSLMENFDRNDIQDTTPLNLPTPPNPPGTPHPVFPFRQVDSLSCGAMVLRAGATAVQDSIFIGTGEGHFGTGAIFGIGPLVSFNGGATWQTEKVDGGLSLVGEGFFALALDPDPAQPERVVAATTIGLFRREPDGLGGFHWARKQLDLSLSEENVTSSVVVARTGATTTFFAAYRGGRRVYSSNDGHVWNTLGNRLPSNQGRISLAVRKDDPSIVYAFASTGRVFRFEQGDGRWRQIVNGMPPENRLTNGQGWYDLAIAVAPDNSNRIYLGGGATASDALGNLLPDNPAPPAEAYGGAIWRCDITVTHSGATVTGLRGAGTFLGASIHADTHTIVFSKRLDGTDDPGTMWVGCDGGVYSTNNPLGNGRIFTARNNGLQTLMMHHLALHQTEDSILFCGTQDNGGLRFTGENAWLHSTPGDCGYFVINRANAQDILSTGFNNGLRRSNNGGVSYALTFPNLNLSGTETVEFYAPLTGSPANTLPDANVVAFGTNRLRTSRDFGQTWPQNARHASGFLDGNIRALEFATVDRIFAGTVNGSVYRFDRNGAGNWIRRQIYNANTNVPVAWNVHAPVMDIAIDPTNAERVFIALAGTGPYPHVWHCDSSPATPVWTARSGPAVIGPTSLPQLHHSAVIIDNDNFNPANPIGQHVYVGTDIGVFRTMDGGNTWSLYSSGLPSAAVLDLKILPRREDPPGTTIRPAILRASTHGRGVWERRIDAEVGFQGVELFMRRTELDLGRHKVLSINHPLTGNPVSVQKSPDIKLDAPDISAAYQVPQGQLVDFVHFTQTLLDDPQVFTHDTAVISSKVYVQVHNRGVIAANDVRVVLLLASAEGGVIPNLPAGYKTMVQNGTPINSVDWRTVGTSILHEVRAGFPRIAEFELPSTLFPTATNLTAANDDFCLLVLLHHASDTYASDELNVVNNVTAYAKAAMKTFTVAPLPVGAVLPSNSLHIPLEKFVSIPQSATLGAMPFDAFLGDALRQNDDFLRRNTEALIASPISSRANDTPDEPLTSANNIFIKEEITLNSPVVLEESTPLIWISSKKITIQGTITATGKGAANGEHGDFGGSGGGVAGGTAGKDCLLPLTGVKLLSGGNPGNDGNPISPAWATRALLHPAACKGGASGGGPAGGAGGGIVILCAPTIEFALGGLIDASGQAATGANSGGGGGGLIVLIAGEIIGMKEPPDASPNVIVNGGAGNGGGNGGAGVVLKKIFN